LAHVKLEDRWAKCLSEDFTFGLDFTFDKAHYAVWEITGPVKIQQLN